MCCSFSNGRRTCSGDLLKTFGKRINLIVSFAIGILIVTAAIWATSCSLAAETTGTVTASVTLGGIIHSDSDDTLAFTPDNNTVFFDRSEGSHKMIMVSHRIGEHWAPAHIASFSGRWFDQDPVVAPDGSYLLFDSDRPTEPGGKPLTQSYFIGGKGPGSNIWRVDRTGNGWGEPVWIGPTINKDVFVDFPSIARDGTLYFMLWNPREKAMQIWRSKYKGGRYLPPEFVNLGDHRASVHDPAVAPDESFVVFDYGKVKGGLGRLCIAFHEGDHWGIPIDFGDALNKDLPWGSHLAPDGHTVYVTGQTGIQSISLDPWLKTHRRISERPCLLWGRSARNDSDGRGASFLVTDQMIDAELTPYQKAAIETVRSRAIDSICAASDEIGAILQRSALNAGLLDAALTAMRIGARTERVTFRKESERLLWLK